MSFLANPTVRNVLQIVLAVVIVILGIVLYETIRQPQREFAREMAITETSRERMSHLRRALIAYEREYVGYPATLDSLEHVIRHDSFFVAQRETIFELGEGETLIIDSLFYAARGPRFHYIGLHDDSLNVWTYLLRNPVTGDSIGTANPQIASDRRNVASWE